MANVYTVTQDWDAGVNSATPDHCYSAETLIYAGWELVGGAWRVHRYLFVPKALISNAVFGDNVCVARLYFRTDGHGTEMLITNAGIQTSPPSATWNLTHQYITDNPGPKRPFRFDSGISWDYIDIPIAQLKKGLQGFPICIRELSQSEALTRIWSKESWSPPYIKYWIMHSPSFSSGSVSGLSQVSLAWSTSPCSGDDFFYGSIISGMGRKVYGPGTATSITLTNQPNGRRISYILRGVYNAYSGYAYSAGLSVRTIDILNDVRDLSVAKYGAAPRHKLAWSIPPIGDAVNGQNPASYLIKHSKTGAAPWTSLDPVAGTSTSLVRSEYGRNYYTITAYYENITNKPRPSVNAYSVESGPVKIFLNAKPTAVASTPNLSIVSPSSCVFTGSFNNNGDGDSFNQYRIKIEYQNDAGTWVQLGNIIESGANISGNTFTSASVNLSSLLSSIAGKIARWSLQVQDNGATYGIGFKGGPHENLWSDWSNPNIFYVNGKPGATIESPATETYDDETSPTIMIRYTEPNEDFVVATQRATASRVVIEQRTGGAWVGIYDETSTISVAKDEATNHVVSVPLTQAYRYKISAYLRDNTGASNNWSDPSVVYYNCYYEIPAVAGVTEYTYAAPAIDPGGIQETGLHASRSRQGWPVEITGQNFGDRAGNTELEFYGYEIPLPPAANWTDTSITFIAPVSKEEGSNEYPPITHPGNLNNLLYIKTHWINNGIKTRILNLDGVSFVEDVETFSIYAKDPVLDSVSDYSVATNQLIELHGSNLGPHFEYNYFGAGSQGEGNYTPGDVTTPQRMVKFTAVDPAIGPDGGTIEIESTRRIALNYSFLDGGWTEDRVMVYVPENAASEVIVESPWSWDTTSDGETLTVSCHFIEKDPKPILYWGELCVINGLGFGDRQGHSKMLLSAGGVTVEMVVSEWTNQQLWFIFGGFNLSQFPHGVFPFGQNIMISIVKYYEDGETVRCQDAVTVEAWESESARRVAIEATTDAMKNRGYGDDVTTYGLTIPPGGGGVMQKSLRIVGGDIAFDSGGKLEYITRRPKLLQDMLINILTPLKNDKYHTNFGCEYEFSVGGIYDDEWYQHNLKAEIQRILNNYVARQREQMRFKQSLFTTSQGGMFIWDVEYIKDVKDIRIVSKETLIQITIYLVTSRGDLEVRARMNRSA